MRRNLHVATQESPLFQRCGSSPKQPSCYIVLGYIKEIFTNVFQKDVSIEEVKCEANNDDNCIFEIKAIS